VFLVKERYSMRKALAAVVSGLTTPHLSPLLEEYTMEQSCRRSGALVLSTIGLCLVSVLVPDHGLAQQKYTFEERPEWSTSRYVQQYAIDVGDVPGHKIRILELQWIYNEQSQLAVSGVKVKESWARAYTDYTNGKGRSWGYGIWILADGSKIYLESTGTTIAEPTSTGSVKGSYHGVARFVGGTGKFSRIRGTMMEANDFDNDPKAGYNKVETRGEYWFEE
jgi:hypothetical protein